MKEDAVQHNTQTLKALIMRAKEGDREAFEEIYTAYYTPLFRYTLSRIKNVSDAEDITQTVFMKIWNALPSWNVGHTSPLAFFFTVARTTLIDYVRKNSYKEIVSDEIIYEHGESVEGTDTASVARENSELIRSAVKNLSKEQQEIIELYYTQDLTYSEIAEIVGKREDAIRQLHSRALKKLREYIQ